MAADEDPRRAKIRELCTDHLSRGDATGWFDALYRSAQGDPAAIPWARLRQNLQLSEWADRVGLSGANGRKRALVVGSGLGDDAEYLAARGFRTTAFDVAPAAIEWSCKRFPDSPVEYVVADLLDPPAAWRGAFDFVYECYTLQPLPPDVRAKAFAPLAGMLAPGGRLLVITRARDDDEPPGEMPWPLSRAELKGFEAAGLTITSFEDYLDNETPPQRRFRVVYERRA